jgi:hypothetical protein
MRTTRIQLIVTGTMEEMALHLSLRQLFRRTNANVEFLPPQRTQSFTAAPLQSLPPARRATASRAAKLAGYLAAAVTRSGTATASKAPPPADYVVAVDDLELVNAHQPAFVLEYFRHTLLAYVAEHYKQPDAQNRVYRALAQRASLHLFVPMPEAYFFGEPAALARANALKAPCRFDSARDVEDFEVDDPGYLAPAPMGAPWNGRERHRHPKNYVRYLCDPTGQIPRAYRETHEGAEALRTLDWQKVLRDETHAQFARALIGDIADALDIPSPCPGTCSHLTARRDGGVLRNI